MEDLQMPFKTRFEDILAKWKWLDWDAVYETFKFLFLFVFLTLQKIFRIFFRVQKEKSLNGEVILVTGAAMGVGKEVCRELAESGATCIVLWDVNTEENSRVADQLKKLGVKNVIKETVDVSDPGRVREAAFKLRHEVGPVTILVNNAGIAPMQPLFQLKAEAIQKTFGVNVLSQFWTLQEFLPDMIKMKKGHIVTICSTMGIDPIRGCSPYNSSKAAANALVESMKDEIDNMGLTENIKFTTIFPFFIKTKLVDEATTGLRLKFRLPWLTPFLDVEYVGKKVVEAIKFEQETVFLPDQFEIYARLLPFISRDLHKAWVDFVIKEFKYLTPSNLEKKKSAMDRMDMELDKETTSKSF